MVRVGQSILINNNMIVYAITVDLYYLLSVLISVCISYGTVSKARVVNDRVVLGQLN